MDLPSVNVDALSKNELVLELKKVIISNAPSNSSTLHSMHSSCLQLGSDQRLSPSAPQLLDQFSGPCNSYFHLQLFLQLACMPACLHA